MSYGAHWGIILVTHGNALLSGLKISDSFQINRHSFTGEAFKFIDKTASHEPHQSHIYASSLQEWIRKLQESYCQGLRIYKNGQDNWLIEAVYSDYSDHWDKTGRPGSYTIIHEKVAARQKTTDTPIYSLSELLSSFEAILLRAIAISKKNKLNQWFIDKFHSSLSILKSNSEPPLEGMAVESQLPLEAAKLLRAAQVAWVFGGQGWWNDVCFDDKNEQKEFDEINKSLFEQVNKLLVVCPNLSYPK